MRLAMHCRLMRGEHSLDAATPIRRRACGLVRMLPQLCLRLVSGEYRR